VNKRTHLDLFSGIGGFALAAQWAGFTTIGFCEKEPYAQKVLVEKFGAVLADAECVRRGKSSQKSKAAQKSLSETQRQESPFGIGSNRYPTIHPDIFQLDGRQYAGVSLLTGGFPCQPFSHAGKRRGKEDDRHLWPEMLRVIGEARPRWVLGENVAGIIGMELDSVLSDLENISYTAWPVVIPACAVDARHRRDRVWIVAYTTQQLRNGSGNAGPRRRSEYSNGGEDVADADAAGLGERRRPVTIQPEHAATEHGCTWQPETEWFAKSGMGRVAHGIPHRSHRLKGLGNAIVPQVAYQILKAMILTESHA
jgi:DNA (cytosine-5)-methyltransferase 1